MEYRLGNSIRIKSKGETIKLKCPHCEKEVQFGVFSNIERRLDAEKFLDVKTVYFLICPNCTSVYTVDEVTGDEFTKGRQDAIDTWDFKDLKEFKPQI